MHVTETHTTENKHKKQSNYTRTLKQRPRVRVTAYLLVMQMSEFELSGPVFHTQSRISFHGASEHVAGGFGPQLCTTSWKRHQFCHCLWGNPKMTAIKQKLHFGEGSICYTSVSILKKKWFKCYFVYIKLFLIYIYNNIYIYIYSIPVNISILQLLCLLHLHKR